ncbi:MAG TPA: TIGR03808 family TAT-translocated repetitive protein [Devosiaceae bacterium]|nr:TIGR03808 family TAT-translocated repetitive protein [Devosiaceae bacterium]
MNIDRRRLLAGIAALAAVRPLAAVAKSAPPSISLAASDFGMVANGNADLSAALQRAVDAAAARGVPLLLTGGTYRASNIRLSGGTTIEGVAGATVIVAIGDAPIFHAEGQSGIAIKLLTLDGSGGGPTDDRAGLIALSHCDDLRLDGVAFTDGPGNGLFLDGCSGSVDGCSFSRHASAAIFAINSHELSLTRNTVSDCGNAGILVWRDEAGADGTIVSGNHISRILARSGGSGQNGNGINVFRADNVVVAENVIDACDFSAIRANTTRNAVIRGNACTNLKEVAIYSEFAFSGSVIDGNVVDGASGGISITNFDQGGQLAVCTGNIVRNILPRSPTNPDATPFGIYAEADTAITGNAVSNVPGFGIGAGTGRFLRNVVIADNVISAADTGIGVSVAEGAGSVRIAGNMISGARVNGIAGLKWDQVASGDLAADAARYPNVSIEGNVVGA